MEHFWEHPVGTVHTAEGSSLRQRIVQIKVNMWHFYEGIDKMSIIKYVLKLNFTSTFYFGREKFAISKKKFNK